MAYARLFPDFDRWAWWCPLNQRTASVAGRAPALAPRLAPARVHEARVAPRVQRGREAFAGTQMPNNPPRMTLSSRPQSRPAASWALKSGPPARNGKLLLPASRADAKVSLRLSALSKAHGPRKIKRRRFALMTPKTHGQSTQKKAAEELCQSAGTGESDVKTEKT